MATGSDGGVSSEGNVYFNFRQEGLIKRWEKTMLRSWEVLDRRKTNVSTWFIIYINSFLVTFDEFTNLQGSRKEKEKKKTFGNFYRVKSNSLIRTRLSKKQNTRVNNVSFTGEIDYFDRYTWYYLVLSMGSGLPRIRRIYVCYMGTVPDVEPKSLVLLLLSFD